MFDSLDANQRAKLWLERYPEGEVVGLLMTPELPTDTAQLLNSAELEVVTKYPLNCPSDNGSINVHFPLHWECYYYYDKCAEEEPGEEAPTRGVSVRH